MDALPLYMLIGLLCVALGLITWLVRTVVSTTKDLVTHAMNQAADARRIVLDHNELVTDILDTERATHITALESQRHQAVDLVRTVLHGDTDTSSDEPLESPGVEPPDAIIVDSELIDPSDAWLPDAGIDSLAPPLPVHEIDPATIGRSGQTGVVGE